MAGGSKDAVRYGGQSCWIGGCLSEPLGPQEQRLHFQVLEGVGHFFEALGNDSGNDEAHDEPADAHAIGERIEAGEHVDQNKDTIQGQMR